VTSLRSDCSSVVAAAAAALQQRFIHTLTGARPAALLRQCGECEGSTQLNLTSTRSDCYSEACSAAIVVVAAAAAVHQRSIGALTRSQARDLQRCCVEASEMLQRGVESDGSSELQVTSTRSDCYSEATSASCCCRCAATCSDAVLKATVARI
jgi:hypothetical protein